MPDYQLSKIYKIVSPHTDKIYIGSTTQKYLKSRLQGHIGCYKDYKNGTRKRTITSFILLELGDADIILIENYPCNSKDELHKREREIIEQNMDKCVNKMIPTRKFKEWYESKSDDYKNRRAEKHLKRNIDPDKYKIKLEKKRQNAGEIKQCPHCNKSMRRDSIGKHIKSWCPVVKSSTD